MKRLFVREISNALTPGEAYRCLSTGAGGSALLESARVSNPLGRWSIVAAQPIDRFLSKARQNPFPVLQKKLKAWQVESDSRVPFVGGAIGFLSYECAAFLEPKRKVAHPAGAFPSAHFLFFDRAVVFDHILKKTYFVFCADRQVTQRAISRAFDSMERLLLAGGSGKQGHPFSGDVRTTLSRSEFTKRVLLIKEQIARGNLYQANLAQLISFEAPLDPAALYARLKRLNPSPFFGMLDTGSECILSGSPERLLRLEGRRLDTRPIAGTRPRGASKAQNCGLSQELFLSEKERAEHVMLVDLERNDLGRVCEPGSVRVDEFMTREEYSHVQHIVSNVEGRLREGLSGVDALAAFFPGGTITGAPKIRSMEMIRQLEPAPRGPYTGSLGYFSFSGDMDFNILIRSLFIRGSRAYLGAGAGIVADSDPDKEYDETLYKAHAVLEAAVGVPSTRRYLAAAGVHRS